MATIVTITTILRRERNKLRQYALHNGWDEQSPLLRWLELHFNGVIKAKLIEYEAIRQSDLVEAKKLQAQLAEEVKAQAALVDLEAELIADIVIDARESEV